MNAFANCTSSRAPTNIAVAATLIRNPRILAPRTSLRVMWDDQTMMVRMHTWTTRKRVRLFAVTNSDINNSKPRQHQNKRENQREREVHACRMPKFKRPNDVRK